MKSVQIKWITNVSGLAEELRINGASIVMGSCDEVNQVLRGIERTLDIVGVPYKTEVAFHEEGEK